MRGPLFYVGGSLLALAAGVFLVYLLYQAGRKFRSLIRDNRCRQFAENASRKEREGDIPAAMVLYLKAEGSWSLNSWDGGRDSWQKDLDRLSAIASGIVRVLRREPGTTYADFTATTREMRDILRERANFAIDGRRMLPEVTVRWRASLDRLKVLRRRLREVCDPKSARRQRRS